MTLADILSDENKDAAAVLRVLRWLDSAKGKKVKPTRQDQPTEHDRPADRLCRLRASAGAVGSPHLRTLRTEF